MDSSYSLDEYVRDLRTIAAEETDPIIIAERVAPLAKQFAQTTGWMRPEYRDCDAEQGFGVHLLHEEQNHDLAIFVFSWLPNRGTTPHNHKTWGVVVGVEGNEQEVNYERRDDRTRAGFADLSRNGARVMAAGDIARCYPEHIHSVRNIGKDISISLHTYGRHINYTGRSQFDLENKSERTFAIKIARDEHARG